MILTVIIDNTSLDDSSIKIGHSNTHAIKSLH